jgi:hypothetical protein
MLSPARISLEGTGPRARGLTQPVMGGEAGGVLIPPLLRASQPGQGPTHAA